VLGHKHVPPQYLRAPARARLALLQGLIDSDGHIDAVRGRVRFTNTDKGLADAVAELARSLGEVVHRIERDSRGFGKTVRAYEVCWLPSVCPVTFRSKAVRVRARQLAAYRGVKAVERVESVPTRCIVVDSFTHTYLAGTEMVPTHNSCIVEGRRWLPQSPELEQGLAQEGRVRTDISPDVLEQAVPEFIDSTAEDVTEEGTAEPAPVDTAVEGPGPEQPTTTGTGWPKTRKPADAKAEPEGEATT
jgi:hypothetical protein